jgi:hypothetical protein
VRVIFPEVAGEPPSTSRSRRSFWISCPVTWGEFYLRYLTWAECERAGYTWAMVEAEKYTWEEFQLAVLPEE